MKIFVSSTYEDLKRHRRAVRDTILRLGHQPVCMEDFGSRPDPWNVAALNAIADCGAVVGIYAHRYGSEPKGSTLSITEQEFDRASELRIPCFCYIVDSTYRWQQSLMDGGVKRDKLVRFIQKVNALLRSTFTTPHDLAAKVAADLGRELLRFVPAISPRRLHELPPAPQDFYGRELELRKLQEIAAKRNGQAISIRGMGGIGKTALGLVFAGGLVEEYPDAQFYVDLQGTAEQSMSSADVMAHVILGFYPSAAIPSRSNDLAGMYRSVLSGAKVLLFLDNVQQANQIADLIPTSGSLMLFTSRWRFPLSGTSTIDLGPMDEREARGLVLDIDARIGDDAAKLAALAGFVPLAICVLARTLHERPDISPSDLIGRITNDVDRAQLTGVADRLTASFQLLPVETQKSFPALGLFEEGFTVPAAAAVWQVDQQTAHSTLGLLYSWSFVEWNNTASRYRLHDLVRAFIKPKLKYETTIRTAVVEYFSLYALTHSSDESALAVEKQNLLAAVDEAVGLAAWPSVYQLGRSMKEFLRLRGEWPTLENVLQKGLEASQKSSDLGQEAWFRHELSHLFTSTRRYRVALTFATGSLQISRRLHDEFGVARSTRQLGLIKRRTKHLDESMKYFRNSLRSYRKLRSPEGESLCLHSIGSLYREAGKSKLAELYYTQSLRIRQKVGDKTGIGATLFQLSRILFERTEYQQARKLCEEVLNTTQDVVFRSRCQVLLGRILAAQGDVVQGLVVLQAGCDMLSRIQSPEAKAARKHIAELKSI